MFLGGRDGGRLGGAENGRQGERGGAGGVGRGVCVSVCVYAFRHMLVRVPFFSNMCRHDDCIINRSLLPYK